MPFEYRPASQEELERLWNYNIAVNAGDQRWEDWKDVYIEYNQKKLARTYAVIHNGEPIGEGTLLFSPQCGAIDGRTGLADEKEVANINALRIRKEWEGQGHISQLMRVMEEAALSMGYCRLTIGVEARETRNLAIYLHWGYTKLICHEIEEGVLVLYYEKELR